MTQVWTDGSHAGTLGGWACLIDGELFSGVYGKTVNEAELFAIFQAVELCPPYEHTHIHTDSMLAINLLSGKWHTSKPRLRPLVQIITATAKEKELQLRLTHTRGHRDDANNITVDHAARYESRAT